MQTTRYEMTTTQIYNYEINFTLVAREEEKFFFFHKNSKNVPTFHKITQYPLNKLVK